jgi:predicted phage-related endonuclease
MLSIELTERIKEYKEYSAMIEELSILKDAIADELKALMVATDQSKMTIGQYTLTYSDCSRRDIDKKALANEHNEIYNAYLKESFYKRFTVS